MYDALVPSRNRVGSAEGLSQQESELGLIANLAPQMLGIMEPDGRVSWGNKVALDYLGVPLADLGSDDLRPRIFHPDDLQNLDEQRRRALLSGMPFERELRIRGKDGNYRWFLVRYRPLKDAEGHIVRWYGAATDIEDRRAAEEALRRSEAYLAEAQRLTHTGSWAWDPAAQKTPYWSEEMFRIFGFDPQEGVPTTENIRQRVVQEDLWNLIRKVIREKSNFVGEYAIVLPDGTVRHIETIGHPVLDANGEIVEFVGTSMDVTERKRAEEEQSKLRQHLHQAQKMEAIGKLAGGVAHDFNNILSIINGYSQSLLNEPDLKEAHRSSVEEILATGQRAASLTRQLLIFSRKLALQPKVISLNSIIEGFNKMLRRLVGDEIEVRTVLDPNLSAVNADPTQMEQVLLNFCVNARDAMPGGGKITIETSNLVLDDAAAAQQFSLKAGRYVKLSVSDTGIGMDQETQSRIFEPFFTTKGQEHGTGLGLSTVYGIVKQSGGHVSVYSEPGRGTTFRVYLPAVSQPIESREQESMPEELMRGCETILLVEDTAPLRDLYRRVLEDKGYTVLEAADGEQAVQVAESFEGHIALLLTDVSLPKIQGPALAEILLQQRPALKVLLMSGLSGDALTGPGHRTHAGAFLQKPFVVEELFRKLRETLDSQPEEPGNLAA